MLQCIYLDLQQAPQVAFKCNVNGVKHVGREGGIYLESIFALYIHAEYVLKWFAQLRSVTEPIIDGGGLYNCNRCFENKWLRII